MDYEQTQHEIDLMTLLKILIGKWYLIVATTLLGFFGAFLYAYMVLDHEYTANASMIILVSNENQSSEQNFNFSSKLKSTYTELAKSDIVVFRVIEELGLEYSPRELREMMTITGVQDTIIIKLSIVTINANHAQEIANKTVSVMQEISTTFEGFDNIEILDTAQLPIHPSGPNRLLYVVIGTLLGGILGVGIVFVIEMLDQTIKTSYDIETKLKLRVLAAIPDYEMPEDLDRL
jgi:capsular polysaccharide biosynthesis protein